MNDIFSKRFDLRPISNPEIIIREEAPEALRFYLKESFYKNNGEPLSLRKIVCLITKEADNRNNWANNDYTKREVDDLIYGIEWYKIYDIIEAIISDNTDKMFKKSEFIKEINEFFIEKGIGWKIENNRIEYRGEGQFEMATREVIDILEEKGLKTAKNEIEQAIKDLSRRPHPDLTGAITHSMVCLECVFKKLSGNKRDKSLTLGELLTKYSDFIPKPLDKACENLWGFSSQHGRHMQEGGEPSYEDSELIVNVTAAVSIYLSKKIKPKIKDTDTGLPF